MALIRIHEKPNAVPVNASVFILSTKVNGVWYDQKVTWEQLKGLIGALDNLENYYKKSETYTKQEVNQLIAQIPSFTVEIVQELPTEDISTTTLYLVPKTTAGTLDYYDEFINLDGTTSGWEYVGKTEVDLSNYYTKAETEAYVKGDGADYIAGTKTYSTLTTTAKTILGAINEAAGAASGAQRDATQALADASAAQGTANSASSAASSAQGTADNALTAAGNAANAASAAQGTANNAITAIGALATVASTGDYNDLINKPTIDAELSEESERAVQNKVITAALYARDDAYLLSQLDGTKATYDRIMREWFSVRGASDMTPAELTALCCEWYEKTVKEWDGFVTFDQPGVTGGSTSQYGTKGGDNAGLVCEPSTDSTKGRDDYEGLPLFACKDVNWVIDPDTLDVMVTAIDGITTNFKRNDPTVYVGVMQATGWRYQYEDTETYTQGYRADYLATYADIEPLPEAVRVDGSVRPFVVHSKYMAGVNNGKLTACSGVHVKTNESHNSIHAYYAAQGAGYSGSTTADDAFLKLMAFIKYGSMSLDGIMNGCNNYNVQYYAQVSETGVKRIILPTSQIIEEGSTVLVGVYDGSSADRGTAANYSISGASGVTVTAVEDVTIDGTAYKAVYVDTDETFDTTANGTATEGSTIVSTFHWACGSCDSVKGNDGSPVSNTDSKHPFRLQGIEAMVGGYEVYTDVIMNIEAIENISYYVPYITKRAANQSSSITANYTGLTDLKVQCPASAGWQYPRRLKYKSGVAYPADLGGNTSTYLRDGFYMNGQGTTATREWMAFGHLNVGASAGLSYVYGVYGLTSGNWTCLPRLSPTGNRGEWTA